MEQKTSSGSPKESKISQNLIIAIIGAVATIAAAVIPFVLSRNNTSPSPSPAPLIITAVITATPAPILPTETAVVLPTEVPSTLTPTLEPPTATATAQEGIFNGFLASDIKGVFTTSKYKPDQIIYLFFDINDPTNKNMIRIVWSVVDVKGFLPGTVRSDITDIATVNKYKTQSNHSANPWAAGKYKVDLYLNDTLQQTIEFEIVP